MATWPSILPQSLPVRSPEERDENRVVTQMDHGKAKMRERFTSIPLFLSPLPARYVYNAQQKAALETFWTDTTYGGSDEFSWTDPIPGLGTVNVRFVTRPKYNPITGGGSRQKFEVTVVFEVVP